MENNKKKVVNIIMKKLILNYLCKYGGTSLLLSPMGLGKSDLNGEVTILQWLTSYSLHCGIQFGTWQG